MTPFFEPPQIVLMLKGGSVFILTILGGPAAYVVNYVIRLTCPEALVTNDALGFKVVN